MGKDTMTAASVDHGPGASSTAVASRERELKLTCDPEVFARDALLALLVHELGAEVAEVGVVVHVDTYLDTRSRSLARAGLAARCRSRSGRRSVQLKPEPLLPQLLFERTEIGAGLRRGDDAGRALKELVERWFPIRLRGVPVPELVLRNRREQLDVVCAGGCRAELCLDRVSVYPPGSRRRAGEFVELELELIAGDEQQFERVAASIAALAGVSPSGRSKQRRAREILGLADHSFGAAAPDFGALATADEVARAICRTLLEAMRSYEPGTWVGLDPEHLHKMRVATRRLRAALRNFDGCFDRRTTEYLWRSFSWVAGVLGEVRDLDVHRMDAIAWQRRLGDDQSRGGWQELGAALDERWFAARRRLLEALGSERYRRLCQRAAEVFVGPAPRRVSGHPGARPVVELARDMLCKRVRQFRRAARRCGARPVPANVHAFRIAGKKLRYTAEFFRPLYDDAFRRRIGRLSRFQDVLGRFQDGVVAGELAAELRDAALASHGSPAYLYVLGRLVSWTEASAAAAGAEVADAYRRAGGKALLRFIERTATDAAAVAGRLVAAEEQAAEAVSRAADERKVVQQRIVVRGPGARAERPGGSAAAGKRRRTSKRVRRIG